jgi:hypothetical protein
MKTQSLSSIVILLAIAAFTTASPVRAQSVSVSASPSTITNEGEETTITLTVSPPPSRNIAVNLIMTGTAALGSDYVLIGDFNKAGQVIIAAGQSTSTITLHSLYDDDGQFNETAVCNIIGGKRYRVGSPSHAQVTIENKP